MSDVDHYVWEGYYIRGQYDDPSDSVYATTCGECARRTAEMAGVENDAWEENDRVDYPLYQIHDSKHHIVTVVRRPVYGGGDSDV